MMRGPLYGGGGHVLTALGQLRSQPRGVTLAIQ